MSKIEAVNKKCHSRPACKTVEASFEFVKFGRINTLDETFQAEVTIESKWVFDDDSIEDKYNPNKHWNPQLKVENALAPCNHVKYVQINENNQVIIKETRKYNGLFWQQLNLRNFPVDVQKLSVVLTSQLPKEKLQLVTDPVKFSFIHFEATQTFLDLQKFHLYRLVKIGNFSNKRNKLDKKEKNKTSVKQISKFRDTFLPPKLVAKAYVSRFPEYWLYNAALLILVITVLALGTFAIYVKYPHFRLQTTYTLLLTSISFKWVINRAMPPIFYMTSLDAYHIVCIILIACVGIWHSLVGSFWSLERAEELDTAAVITFGCIFIVINSVFMIWLYKANAKKRKVVKKEAEYLNINKDQFITYDD